MDNDIANEATLSDEHKTNEIIDSASQIVPQQDSQLSEDEEQKKKLSGMIESAESTLAHLQKVSASVQSVVEKILAIENTSNDSLTEINTQHTAASDKLAKIEESVTSAANHEKSAKDYTTKLSDLSTEAQKYLAAIQTIRDNTNQLETDVSSNAKLVSQHELVAIASTTNAEAQSKAATMAAEEASKNQVTSASALTAVQSALKTSEALQAEARTAATAAKTSAEGAETSLDEIKSTAGLAIAEQTKAEKARAEAAQSADKAQKAEKMIAAINESVVALKETIDQRDKELASWQAKYDQLHLKIEKLLPGATSAGLAEAFRKQKESYNSPKIFCVASFFLCAAFLAFSYMIPVPQDSEWVKHINNPLEGIIYDIVHKSPFYLPCVAVLALTYRIYNIADRLQQDYAYKERMATSFEGFKTQFESINLPNSLEPPINTLCNKLLTIIGQHPGRFYEHKDTAYPPSISSVLSPEKRRTQQELVDLEEDEVKKVISSMNGPS